MNHQSPAKQRFEKKSAVANAVAVAVLGCGAAFLGCKNDGYEVETCEPDGGLALPTHGIPSMGNPASHVKITVFGDVTCPITKQLVVALDNYIKTEGLDSVELFYRHFPRSPEPPSTSTALALAAAHLQGSEAFWSLYWRLVLMDDLSAEAIVSAGKASVSDPTAFLEDLESAEVAEAVEADIILGREIGLRGVPGVILCGQKINGTYRDIIDNLDFLIGGENASNSN